MKSVLRIGSALIFFIITVLFNIGLIDIRFEEINYLLGKVALDEDASNAFSIVAKYELIKRRMELGEESTENYELEARIQALTSGDQFTKRDDGLYKKKQYLIPVRFFLNSVRFLLGKEIISLQEENKIIKVLEIGYFWERNRKYPEAIKIYDDALGMTGLGTGVRAAVLLHKAFCHSMMSEYEKAKEIYERVIYMYPNTEAGMISWKLLDFLESIEEKREQVKSTNLNDFEKAKQYYLVMDYRNSIKYFSIFLQNNEKDKRVAEARYFKGRSHEELGETEVAVEEYRKTIKIDKTKRWAREANRRMLMLGEFYDYQKKMADEAQKQLAAYQDGSFMNKVDRFREMMTESSLREELLNKEGSKKRKKDSVDKDVMDLINSIGDLDLTGEKDRKKALEKEMEKFRKELIASGIKSEAQIKEFERKRALRGNPFRRPSMLKRTIDGNVNQLRYIYNKKLRKGVRLSGKIFVEMRIEPNGGISSAKVINSNMGDQGFEDDVLTKISTWKFKPVPDSLGALNIRYPFEFYEEK